MLGFGIPGSGVETIEAINVSKCFDLTSEPMKLWRVLAKLGLESPLTAVSYTVTP